MANPDTITIGSDTFDVYAPRADTDSYFNGKLGRSSWAGSGGTDKDRALVSATRLFDLENWEGAPADLVTPQPIAWPRTGVVDKNGTAVGAAVFPEDLLNGFYELAQAVIDDPAIADTVDTSSNIKGVTADVVTVRFFRATEGTRYPRSVFDYISQFLGGDTALLAFASGVDVESSFETFGGLLNGPYK